MANGFTLIIFEVLYTHNIVLSQTLSTQIFLKDAFSLISGVHEQTI